MKFGRLSIYLFLVILIGLAIFGLQPFKTSIDAETVSRGQQSNTSVNNIPSFENNTLIDDEKPFTKIADNLGKKKEYKQLEFDFSEKKKDVPVRKPGAVPPKTQTIKKFKEILKK